MKGPLHLTRAYSFSFIVFISGGGAKDLVTHVSIRSAIKRDGIHINCVTSFMDDSLPRPILREGLKRSAGVCLSSSTRSWRGRDSPDSSSLRSASSRRCSPATSRAETKATRTVLNRFQNYGEILTLMITLLEYLCRNMLILSLTYTLIHRCKLHSLHAWLVHHAWLWDKTLEPLNWIRVISYLAPVLTLPNLT